MEVIPNPHLDIKGYLKKLNNLTLIFNLSVRDMFK